MMKKTTLALSLICLGTSAQASDYTPAVGSSPEKIYSEACAACHGEQGSGKFGFALKLTETELSTEQIIDKTRNGSTFMPDYPNLTEEQLSGLASYIKNLPAN